MSATRPEHTPRVRWGVRGDEVVGQQPEYADVAAAAAALDPSEREVLRLAIAAARGRRT